MAWITTTFRSKTLNMPIEAEILVPQAGVWGMEQKDNYKVIVLLHGMYNDRTEWLFKSDIFNCVKDKPVLVFMPSGKNSFYINTYNGYNYMDFITKEIPEFIKRHFKVSDRKEDWMIAGESMGGFGAMVCGLNAGDIYGNIGALSGAYDIKYMMSENGFKGADMVFGKDCETVLKSSVNPFWQCHRVDEANRPRIFMCCGKQDELIDVNVDLYDELKPEYDVIFSQDEGGHSFQYWNGVLPQLVSWFMEVKV